MTANRVRTQPFPLKIMFVIAVLGLACLSAACSPVISVGAASSASIGQLTPTHPRENIKVEEYPLVEQSADNPTHAGFLAHLPEQALTRRAAWRTAPPEEALRLPNQALSLFGYRLDMNPSAPFRAYALYQGGRLVQDGILHFWPVTLNAAGSDFLLPFETLAGQRLAASRGGLSPWPGSQAAAASPPVYIGDQLAYASVDNSMLMVQSDAQVFYQQNSLAPAQPGALSTWSGHWALETDGNVIVDGQSLKESLNAERVFFWQTINNQPFFFYTKDSLTRMNYAGRSLPYVYDLIITGETPETALFSPGSNANMVWFYALRDGLWYYVEAGVFAE